MGYISPIHMHRQKISGSMWTKALRSTLVSEARYYVGDVHEHSSRPAEEVVPIRTLVDQLACEATVALLTVGLERSTASLYKPRASTKKPSADGSPRIRTAISLRHQLRM